MRCNNLAKLSNAISIKKITEQVGAENIVVDNINKIVSTPAYVEGKSIGEIAVGITKLVDKLLELI